MRFQDQTPAVEREPEQVEPHVRPSEKWAPAYQVIKCVICGVQTPKVSKRTRFCGTACEAKYYYRKKKVAQQPAEPLVVPDVGGPVSITEKETFGYDGVDKPASRLLGNEKRATKHVNTDMLVSEFPAVRKGATDGVDKPQVNLEWENHPKQVIASQAVEAGAKIVYFVAGIRSGKTIWLVRELIKQPYVYDVVPNLMFMVAPTNGMMPTPRRFFTSNAGDALVTEKRASDAGPAHFLMKPSHSIPSHYFIVEMHSGEHADRMRGPTIAAAGIDEVQLCKPEVMDILRGRVMESGGVILMAGTATFPGHWTKTEIIDRAYRCGRCHVCVYDHYDLAMGPDGQPEKDPYTGKETRRYVMKDHDPVDCYGDPRIAVITCSSFDNTFLSRDQVEQLRQDYSTKDPIIARRELFAEYTGFEGLIYGRFDRAVHKSPYTVYTVPPDAYIAAGLDFGANDPTVCVIGARIGSTWHVIGEYYDDDRGKSIRDHVEGIKRMAGPVFHRIRSWWHDPAGRIAAMEMSRYGLRPMKPARKRMATGVRWITYRIEVINSLILGRDENEKPLFLINTEKCKGLLHDLENRKWKRYVSKGEDGRERVIDLKGKEVDRNAGDDPAPGNDHGTDASEYLICSEFVKGLYKVQNKASKLPSREEIEEQVKVHESAEAKSISRTISQNVGKVIQSMKKPGRMRSGWSA